MVILVFFLIEGFFVLFFKSQKLHLIQETTPELPQIFTLSLGIAINSTAFFAFTQASSFVYDITSKKKENQKNFTTPYNTTHAKIANNTDTIVAYIKTFLIFYNIQGKYQSTKEIKIQEDEQHSLILLSNGDIIISQLNKTIDTGPIVKISHILIPKNGSNNTIKNFILQDIVINFFPHIKCLPHDDIYFYCFYIGEGGYGFVAGKFYINTLEAFNISLALHKCKTGTNLAIYKTGKKYLIWYGEYYLTMAITIFNTETNTFLKEIIISTILITSFVLNIEPKGNFDLYYIWSTTLYKRHFDSNLNSISELDNSYCFDFYVENTMKYFLLKEQTEVLLIGCVGLFLHKIQNPKCFNLIFTRKKGQNYVIIEFPEEMASQIQFSKVKLDSGTLKNNKGSVDEELIVGNIYYINELKLVYYLDNPYAINIERFNYSFYNCNNLIDTCSITIYNNVSLESSYIISIMDPITTHSNLLLSSITFRECENLLKSHYNINETGHLIFVEVNLNKDNSTENQAHFKSFTQNGTELNMSLCNDVEMKVTYLIKDTSVINSELALKYSDMGIDVFNENDSFFNDICFPFKTENGRDIILSDRKKDIFQNVSLCEYGCIYDNINLEKYTVDCICNVRIDKEHLNLNFFYFAFKKVFIDSNFAVVKCYKLIFDKSIMRTNYGFWIFLSLSFIHLPLLIIYCYDGLVPILKVLGKNNSNPKLKAKDNKNKRIGQLSSHHNLKDNLNEEIKNEKSKRVHFDEEYITNKIIKGKNKNVKFKKKIIKNKLQYDTLQIMDSEMKINPSSRKRFNNNISANYFISKSPLGLNNPRKNKSIIKKNYENNSINTSPFFVNDIKEINIFPSQDNFTHYFYPVIIPSKEKKYRKKNQKNKLKSKKDSSHRLNHKKRYKDKSISKTEDLGRDNDSNLSYSTSKMRICNKNNSTLTKKHSFQPPSNDYLDDYVYESAILFDNRKFCFIYYLCLLIKQPILQVFVFKSPLELKVLRIIKLIFSFSLDFALNALFFRNALISKRYHYEGELEFLFNIQNSIITSLVSCLVGVILSTILNFLSNSKTSLSELQKEKDKNKYESLMKSIIKKLKIKIVFYIIIELILMLFYWYYVSCFGAVYQGTRKSWLQSSLVSFIIRQITPFGIALIIAIIRKISLKTKSPKLFKISLWTYKL